jgi:hypothetical protein
MWYALVVAAVSLAGAAVPLGFKPGHAQLQIYISLAAGALLGAALFHLLPESAHFVPSFGLPAVLGVMVVFFLQRYLAPHSHEVSPDEHEHGHDCRHDRGDSHHHDMNRDVIITIPRKNTARLDRSSPEWWLCWPFRFTHCSTELPWGRRPPTSMTAAPRWFFPFSYRF